MLWKRGREEGKKEFGRVTMAWDGITSGGMVVGRDGPRGVRGADGMDNRRVTLVSCF
jgi:hypothetical protein